MPHRADAPGRTASKRSPTERAIITNRDDSAATSAADAALANRLQLRHLRCLVAVADCGHLGQAAQQLHVTQPAVTKTLNELEALLGLRLFERGRHGTRPTPEAEAVLLPARRTLQALQATVDSVAPDRAERVLQIGVLPTVAPALLPAVLKGVMAGRPQTTLRVHTGRNAALLSQLRQRELDVVVGRLGEAEAMADLVFEHLYAEPLVLVARAGHPVFGAGTTGRAPSRSAADRAAPAALQFDRHPLLLPLPGTLIRQVADAYLTRHRLRPSGGLVETLDGALALAMVEDAGAIWITPLSAVVRALAAGSIRRWPHDITPEEPIGLITRADGRASPALRALRRRLIDAASAHRAGAVT